jgi:hypothetical protein
MGIVTVESFLGQLALRQGNHAAARARYAASLEHQQGWPAVCPPDRLTSRCARYTPHALCAATLWLRDVDQGDGARHDVCEGGLRRQSGQPAA